MRRKWVVIVGLAVVFGACQDYDEPDKWMGWLDFEARALFMRAVCGERGFESIADVLADHENSLLHSMYIATDSWDAEKERIDCMEETSNCEEYWRCKLPEDAENCDESTFEDYCDGDVAVRCSYLNVKSENNYIMRRSDCTVAPGGGSCLATSSEVKCKYDLCEQEDNPTCFEDEVAVYCDSNEYQDMLWMMDCPSMGMECLEHGLCGIPDAIECSETDGPFISVCEGSYIHVCVPWGAYSEDCREMDPDFVCLMDEDDDAYCGMPMGEWQCTEHGSRWCEGSELRVCIYGKIVSYDCASFEEAQCEGDVCVLPD